MSLLTRKQKTVERVNVLGHQLDNSKLNKLGNIRLSPLKSFAVLFFILSFALPQIISRLPEAGIYFTKFSTDKELAQAAEVTVSEKKEELVLIKSEPEIKQTANLKKITLASIWPEEFGQGKVSEKIISSGNSDLTVIKKSQNGKISFIDIWPAEIARDAELPRRLIIPALKISTNIQSLGVAQDGEMDVPSNFTDAGWYEMGPRPGELGNAVLAGHLNNQYGAAGVFWGLNKLKAGDDIYIIDAKGVKLHFRVSVKKIYSINDPLKEIFEGDGRILINLITCNGAWDEKTQNYTSRLVVSAELLAE